MVATACRVAVLLAALAPWTAARAQAPSPFDGTWNVTVTCRPTSTGAAGYVLRFPAQVTKGALVGEYPTNREGASLRLDGTIRRDGTARIRANGITGNPNNTARGTPSGRPYRYTVDAKFTAQSGAGERRETRHCTLHFLRA